MKMRGFSVVEILVVIIVMAILLTLAVVNVRSTQVNARDSERTVDVENIALTFERFHTANHSGGFSRTYPGTTDLSGDYVTKFINNSIHESSLRAPGVETDEPISLISATNNNTTPANVTPTPTLKTYVYQPLTTTGALCLTFDTPCRQFNIYYRLERATSDCPAPTNICIYKSKYR